MERNASHFRHHALAHRRMAPHSGEDAGQAFKTVEDHIAYGGTTYAQRQARRAKRGWKKFTNFLEDNHDDDAVSKGLEATEAAALIGAGKKDLFQQLGSKRFWNHLPHAAGCKFGVGKMKPKHCTPTQFN